MGMAADPNSIRSQMKVKKGPDYERKMAEYAERKRLRKIAEKEELKRWRSLTREQKAEEIRQQTEAREQQLREWNLIRERAYKIPEDEIETMNLSPLQRKVVECYNAMYEASGWGEQTAINETYNAFGKAYVAYVKKEQKEIWPIIQFYVSGWQTKKVRDLGRWAVHRWRAHRPSPVPV